MALGILEEMTIDEVRALAPNVALIPLGSTEPHGPALPYGTDSFTVGAVARRATLQANERGARAICYPTLPISLNNNFRAFPFACRMGVTTFMTMLLEILAQAAADGIRRAVLANGHGGNTDTVRAMLRELAARDNMPFTCMVQSMASADVIAANIQHPSDHAGESEVSIQMFVRPELVRRERMADNPRCQPALPSLNSDKVFFVKPWHRYVPASAGGDQRQASAAKGRALVESSAANMAQLLVELSQAPESATFPYA
jgi:creatinine amidohydrolase